MFLLLLFVLVLAELLLVEDVAALWCSVHSFVSLSSVIEYSASLVVYPESLLPIESLDGFFVSILVETLVHPVLAISPETLQILTLTCVSQLSVGWLSAAKYSVIIQLPRGSCSHKASTGRLTDLDHTWTSTISSGFVNSPEGRSECICSIIERQIDVWLTELTCLELSS